MKTAQQFLWDKHEKVIGQGALTNSKHPRSFIDGVYPKIVSYGHGCYLWDHESNRYVDFICGLGSNLIGYGNVQVEAALKKCLNQGFSLSLSTHHEAELGELLRILFPFVEAVKFTKEGTTACSAAIRMARAYTGRSVVLSEGYHGWSDDFVSMTPPARGIPERDWMKPLKGNEITGEVAAVIVEPVITDCSPNRILYLRELRRLCNMTGTVLIFDEVVTGFRYREFSVAKAHNVHPDLICFGKAIGGGLPISIVGGRSDILNGDYFVSGTFYGEILSLVAAKTVIKLLTKNSEYSIDTLWKNGAYFQSKFNDLAPEIAQIEGYPTRAKFVGNQDLLPLFYQEACRAGILFHPSGTWFYNFPLVYENETVLAICKDILARIKRGEVQRLGKAPEVTFAEKVRRNEKTEEEQKESETKTEKETKPGVFITHGS